VGEFVVGIAAGVEAAAGDASAVEEEGGLLDCGGEAFVAEVLAAVPVGGALVTGGVG
jgi:hypothetical protein